MAITVTVTLSMSADSDTYADLLESMNANPNEVIQELTEIAYADLVERANDGHLRDAVEIKVEEK